MTAKMHETLMRIKLGYCSGLNGRTVNALFERGWIAVKGSGYALTNAGKKAMR